MNNALRHPVLITALLSAGLLSACGGGGGGSSGSYVLDVTATPSVAATAGQQITLNGYATSAGQSIASASWQQTSGPAVTLTNADCATNSANKLSSAGAASAPSGASLGSYICPLTVQLPQSATGANYAFRFTATDSQGNQQSATSKVSANPSQGADLTVVVGPNANLYPGQAYKGTCQSTGGIYSAGQTPIYQWSITGPSGVTPPALASSGPVAQLVAPALSANANFKLGCQVTDGVGQTATGTANLTVYGTSVLPPLVANAGNAQIVATATPVSLTATASANGATPSAPVYYYWKQTGGKNTVILSNANTANASFISPGDPTAPASGTSAPASGASAPAPTVYDTLTFTVYASYQPITADNLSQVPASQQAQTVITVIKQ